MRLPRRDHSIRLCLPLMAALVASPAAARMPDSTDMAACAGFLEAAALYVGDAAEARRLRGVSEAWAAQGTEAARAEGQFYPDFYMVSLRDRSRADWLSQGSDAVGTPEFADTLRRCEHLDSLVDIVASSR